MLADIDVTVPSDEYRQHLYDRVLVKRTRLLAKNKTVREWSLIAKRDIPSGSFVGFYTGSMDRTDCPHGSFYALDMGVSQSCIIPFPDEDHISPFERQRHPLACMNEPVEKTHANCYMTIQDFTHAEIDNVESIQHHANARFFRGLACFACCRIREGEQLTWDYGKHYQNNRVLKGYEAGLQCKKVLDAEVFIQENSRSVLDTLLRTPHYCVFPVLSPTLKSARFKVKRKHTVDSDGEESESFSSGSSHDELYKPHGTVRRQRT